MVQDFHSPLGDNQPSKTQSKWRVFCERELSFLTKYVSIFDNLVYKMQHIPETNYEIGERMANTGNFRDAILRLKISLWLAPNHAKALYLLGCCYISQGEKAKAANALQKLVQLDPTHENGYFMLATLSPNAVPLEHQPTTMPLTIAMDYFANNAAEYEAMQLEQGYKGHQFPDDVLWDLLDRRRTNYQVLELGCGTGLCGVLLAEHAEELVGVDFCKEMIDVANGKRRPDSRRVYTETLLQDIRHFAADIQQPRFDAVVAAHVFNYVGEIDTIFDGMMRGLKAGGYFVFQVERYGVDGRFGLIPDRAQFGHSDGYIRHHLNRVGFQLIANDLVRVFPDRDLVQYVARKPEAE